MLGCELNYGTDNMLTYFGNPEPGGLYTARIYKKSLLERAGVQEGDMIYQMQGYDLGLYGDVNVPWCEDKTTLSTLINRFNIGEKISLTIYRKGIKKELSLTLDILEPLPIHISFPFYDIIDYEIIGGMVIMQLTLNHIAQFGTINPFLIDYRIRDAQYEPRLVVSAVIPNSQTHHTRIIYQGDLLEMVNQQPVTNLQELRKALEQTKDFLTIKTRSKKFMVLSWQQVLTEEADFVKKNIHPMTEFLKKISIK